MTGAEIPIGDEVERLEDWRLARQASAGELGAFEEIYRRHVGRVYALCLRMTADGARAEELTQDVFVRTWQKLGTFRGESAFSSWLVRLTINLVLSDRRSRARKQEWLAAVDLEHHPARAEHHPTVGLDLERAIAHLPPGARAVFVLHDIEGYPHKEIASLTGNATGTCKAQLHRARRLLREALK